MRLAVALASVVLCSYSLLAPILSLDNLESKLPACCRGDGKHRCGMTPEPSKQPAGPALLSSQCAQFPKAVAVPARIGTGLTTAASAAIVTLTDSRADCAQQIEAPRTTPFNWTNQKRGPPTLLSL